MIKRALMSGLLLGALTAGGLLRAHHSVAAAYDTRTVREMSGILTKIVVTNPHGALYLEVENKDGSRTQWIMTTGSANVLANLGFGDSESNPVEAGDTVTIRYFPARNGSPLGFIRTIRLPDEREIELDPD